MLGTALYKDLQPKDPAPIEQNWIKEDVVCFMQDGRVISCQIVRFE